MKSYGDQKFICEYGFKDFGPNFWRPPHARFQVFTVIEPYNWVICDPDKLEELGCVDPPVLIVGILSPGNSKMALQNKYEVFEKSDVKNTGWFIPKSVPYWSTLELMATINAPNSSHQLSS